jgi:hypothetical protein
VSIPSSMASSFHQLMTHNRMEFKENQVWMSLDKMH